MQSKAFSWLDMEAFEDVDETAPGLGLPARERTCGCWGARYGGCMEKMMYRLERLMSQRGRLCQFVMLVFVGSLVMTVGGLAYSYVWTHDDAWDPRDRDSINVVLEGIWEAWTFMADGGTHARVVFPEQRLVGALISIGGIIYMAVVLAVIVDMVRDKMDNLKQGKTIVYERNHTLIMNWTDKTIPLIQELCIANESEGGGVVVVLAGEAIEVMDMELALQLPKRERRGTYVVCRSGSPVIVNDLVKVSAAWAKSVVILASSTSADQADSATLRCVLSLKSLGQKLSGHVVAEVRDVDNEPLLRLVGGRVVETLVSHDVLGRLMLMSVRQPGLAKVYEAVLGFEGHEFYVKEWPELVGIPFGELVERFPRAVPIGIRSADDLLLLNPRSDRVTQRGEHLIVIAEDDNTYRPEPPRPIDVGPLPESEHRRSFKERVLICGWRRDIRDILILLESIMQAGSEVHMMTHCVPVESRNLHLLEEGLDVSSLTNIRLVHHAGNTSVRRRLETIPLESFSSCMIFADQAFEQDTMHADSHSLATLLLIRDIQSTRYSRPPGGTPCPIICEILDSRTQKTIAGHRNLSLSSDFVQSNKLVAQILAMVAEQRKVKLILDELLGVGGVSLLVVPPQLYACPGEVVSFFTLAKRASRMDAILIGYQKRGCIEKTVLNPARKHEPQVWDSFDLAIIAGNRVFDSKGSAMKAFQRMETRRSVSDLASEQKRTSAMESLAAVREHLWEEGSEASFSVPEEEGVRAPMSPSEKLVRLCSSMTDAERSRLRLAFELLAQISTDGSMFAAYAADAVVWRRGMAGATRP